MNILFICKWNRFRSKLAETYFKKINKNKKIKVKSAGLIKGRSLTKYQIRLAKRFDIKIGGKPQGLSSKLLKWQDITIIVADDIPSSIFLKDNEYKKKLIIWKFPDLKTEEQIINKIIKPLMKRIDNLVKKLKAAK